MPSEMHHVHEFALDGTYAQGDRGRRGRWFQVAEGPETWRFTEMEDGPAPGVARVVGHVTVPTAVVMAAVARVMRRKEAQRRLRMNDFEFLAERGWTT